MDRQDLLRACGLTTAGVIYYFFGIYGLGAAFVFVIGYQFYWRIKHGRWMTDDDY